MAKLMKRLMKKLKTTERVIIIGKATTPWLTNAHRLVCIQYKYSMKKESLSNFFYIVDINSNFINMFTIFITTSNLFANCKL